MLWKPDALIYPSSRNVSRLVQFILVEPQLFSYASNYPQASIAKPPSILPLRRRQIWCFEREANKASLLKTDAYELNRACISLTPVNSGASAT